MFFLAISTKYVENGFFFLTCMIAAAILTKILPLLRRKCFWWEETRHQKVR